VIIDRVTFRRRAPALAIALAAPLFLGWSEWLLATNEALYVSLFSEDGPAEYAQAAMFFAAGVISLWMSREFWGQGGRIFTSVRVLLGIGCLFVAMEEISWGQRILLMESPELFREFNLQTETNLHNLVWAQAPLYTLTQLIWGYLAFAWILVPGRLAARLGDRIHLLVPSWYLTFYFASLLWLHNCDATCGMPAEGARLWETAEPGELLVATGALLLVVLERRRLRARATTAGSADS
jgi:hypothetical protein